MLSPRPRTRPGPKHGRAHCQSAKFVVGTTTVSNRNRYPNFGPWPMSKSSAGAFATGSLGWVSEFHLSPASTPAVELLLASNMARGLRARPPSEEGTLGAQIKARPPSGRRQTHLSAARGLSRLGTFNRSNNLVGSLPWYYRACWHQNLAQIAFARLSRTRSSLGQALGCPLTISARGHWIVFVPAASLGYESCLSGFLCGIGP